MGPIDDYKLPRGVALTDEVVRGWNDDTAHLWVVCNLGRRFLLHFVPKLEMDHYPPSDPALNDKLIVAVRKFAGAPYIILGVPLGERSRVETVCKHFNLRLADGFPFAVRTMGVTTFGASRTPPPGAEVFPLHSRRTYTLEPIHANKKRGAEPVLADIIDGAQINDAWDQISRAMGRNQARTN
jgi:hypothetical protein